MVHKKNIPGLVRAFQRFVSETNSGYKLVILGSGEIEMEIKEVIENVGLQDVVLLKGFVQLEELPRYYAFAEALILPSFMDQWGLVTNEAMASGLPVLVSKHCGCVDEIVMHNVNGYLFNPFSQNP